MNKKIFVSFFLTAVFVMGALFVAAPANAQASTLWGAAQTQLGPNAPASAIMALVKKWAVQFSIAIPEWSIPGTRDHTKLNKAFLNTILNGKIARAQSPVVTLTATDQNSNILTSGVTLTTADTINFNQFAGTDGIDLLASLSCSRTILSGGFSVVLPACATVTSEAPGAQTLSSQENYNLASADPGTCVLFTSTVTDASGAQDSAQFNFCVDAATPTISNTGPASANSPLPTPTGTGTLADPLVYNFGTVTNSNVTISGTANNLDSSLIYDFSITQNGGSPLSESRLYPTNALTSVTSHSFSQSAILVPGQNTFVEIIQCSAAPQPSCSGYFEVHKIFDYQPAPAAPSIMIDSSTFNGQLIAINGGHITESGDLIVNFSSDDQAAEFRCAFRSSGDGLAPALTPNDFTPCSSPASYHLDYASGGSIIYAFAVIAANPETGLFSSYVDPNTGTTYPKAAIDFIFATPDVNPPTGSVSTANTSTVAGSVSDSAQIRLNLPDYFAFDSSKGSTGFAIPPVHQVNFDYVSGVGSLTVSINGSSPFDVPFASGQFSFTSPFNGVTLHVGDLLDFTVTDRSGLSSTFSGTVVEAAGDTVAPIITNSFPVVCSSGSAPVAAAILAGAPGGCPTTTVTSNFVNIQGNVTDDIAIGSFRIEVITPSNPTPETIAFTDLSPVNATSYPFQQSYNNFITAGVYNFRETAIDKSGNQTVLTKVVNYSPTGGNDTVAPIISNTLPGACVSTTPPVLSSAILAISVPTCNFGTTTSSSFSIAGNLSDNVGVTSFTIDVIRPDNSQVRIYSLGFVPGFLDRFSTSYDFNAGPGTYRFIETANDGFAGAGGNVGVLEKVVNYNPTGGGVDTQAPTVSQTVNRDRGFCSQSEYRAGAIAASAILAADLPSGTTTTMNCNYTVSTPSVQIAGSITDSLPTSGLRSVFSASVAGTVSGQRNFDVGVIPTGDTGATGNFSYVLELELGNNIVTENICDRAGNCIIVTKNIFYTIPIEKTYRIPSGSEITSSTPIEATSNTNLQTATASLSGDSLVSVVEHRGSQAFFLGSARASQISLAFSDGGLLPGATCQDPKASNYLKEGECFYSAPATGGEIILNRANSSRNAASVLLAAVGSPIFTPIQMQPDTNTVAVGTSQTFSTVVSDTNGLDKMECRFDPGDGHGPGFIIVGPNGELTGSNIWNTAGTWGAQFYCTDALGMQNIVSTQITVNSTTTPAISVSPVNFPFNITGGVSNGYSFTLSAGTSDLSNVQCSVDAGDHTPLITPTIFGGQATAAILAVLGGDVGTGTYSHTYLNAGDYTIIVTCSKTTDPSISASSQTPIHVNAPAATTLTLNIAGQITTYTESADLEFDPRGSFTDVADGILLPGFYNNVRVGWTVGMGRSATIHSDLPPLDTTFTSTMNLGARPLARDTDYTQTFGADNLSETFTPMGNNWAVGNLTVCNSFGGVQSGFGNVAAAGLALFRDGGGILPGINPCGGGIILPPPPVCKTIDCKPEPVPVLNRANSVNNAAAAGLALNFNEGGTFGGQTFVATYTILDLVPPTITLDAVPQYTNQQLTISGNATDDNKRSLLMVSSVAQGISNVEVMVNPDGSFSFPTGFTVDGTYDYTFTAYDIAGNTTQVTVETLYDTLAPVVTKTIVDDDGDGFDEALNFNLGDVPRAPATVSSGVEGLNYSIVDSEGNELESNHVSGSEVSVSLSPFRFAKRITITFFGIDNAGNGGKADAITQKHSIDLCWGVAGRYDGCPSLGQVSVEEVVASGKGPALQTDTALDTKVFALVNGQVCGIDAVPKNWGYIYENCKFENFGQETYSAPVGNPPKPANLQKELQGLGIREGDHTVIVRSRANSDKTTHSYMGFDLIGVTAGKVLSIGFNITPNNTTTFVQNAIFSQNTGGFWSGSNRRQVIKGSELSVYKPDYVEWTNGNQIYPFTFVSDSDWNLDVCLEVPAGYTIVAPGTCDQALISNEAKVVEFQLTESSSNSAAVILAQASADPDVTMVLKTKHSEAGGSVKEATNRYAVDGLSHQGRVALNTQYAPVIAKATAEVEAAKKAELAQAVKVVKPAQKVLAQVVRKSTKLAQAYQAASGVTGEAMSLQRYLNAKGFRVASSGAGSPGNETNVFGPRTKAALKRFQETYANDILAPIGLQQGTGVYGPRTKAFIQTHQ